MSEETRPLLFDRLERVEAKLAELHLAVSNLNDVMRAAHESCEDLRSELRKLQARVDFCQAGGCGDLESRR